MTPDLAPMGTPRKTSPHKALRRILVAAAFLFAFAGGSTLFRNAVAGQSAPAPAAGSVSATQDASAAHRVIAYYFHTTYRCASCQKIEAYTSRAIETAFATELADGRLSFQLVNIEAKGNEHFVQDYELFTKSVVLVDERDGKQVAWRNLSRVWELLHDKDEFFRYIQAETRAYLAGTRS